MSAFRRRLMEQEDTIHWGQPATNVYVIDPPTQYNDRAYNMRVVLSGSNYFYDSDYPLFVGENNINGYYIIFASGFTYRNGVAHTSGDYLGTLNGIIYSIEQYVRSTTLYSNKPVYIWGT